MILFQVTKRALVDQSGDAWPEKLARCLDLAMAIGT
jgi:hypothetical protein